MWKVGDSIRQGEVHGEVTAVNGRFSVYYWLENGTCGECLPHRLEEGYRMARPRKSVDQKKAEAAAKVTNGLLDAVKFCAGGFNENGETYSTHAMLWNGYISTYNGIVMYGHKIDTPLQALPHYGLLLKALKATDGDAVQITQLDQKRIQVKQKGFRTIVPCLDDFSLVSRTAPDNPVSMLDSRMREGFEIMKQIANKRGETVMQSAVLVSNGFMVACDNHMLGMFWHGIGFPELAVPADFIEAVLKVAKPLVSFGYTADQSLTFYFDDGSFIRTQLYAEKYPDWQRAMPTDWSNLQQLPDDFFKALNKIEPFVPKDKTSVYASENLFHTDGDKEHGTAVDCPGLLYAEGGLDIDRLLKLEGRITHIDYTAKDRTRFVGENFRGVLANYLLGDHPRAPDGSELHSSYQLAEPPPSEAAMAAVADVFANGANAAVFNAPQPEGEPEFDDEPDDPAVVAQDMDYGGGGSSGGGGASDGWV